MNFTYTTVKPKDGLFGNVQEDGSWTGIVGELQDQKVDIGTKCLEIVNCHYFDWSDFIPAVTPLAENLERTQVISFSIPIYQARTQIFMENPRDALNYFTYVESLTWMAWTFVGLFSLIAPPFLYVATRLNVFASFLC